MTIECSTNIIISYLMSVAVPYRVHADRYPAVQIVTAVVARPVDLSMKLVIVRTSHRVSRRGARDFWCSHDAKSAKT